MPNPAYYSPSGKAPLPGTMLLFAAGFVAACIAAFLYAGLIHYIPFIYLNFLFCIGAFFITGKAVAKAGKAGHVRSTGRYLLAGLLSGLLLLYLHWAVYLSLITGEIGLSDFSGINAVVGLLSSPGEMWETIKNCAEVGLWSIKGAVVSGGWLWTVWIIEAAALALGTVAVAVSEADHPYSEAAGCWMEKEDLPARLAFAEDTENLKTLLEKGDFTPLLEMAVSDNAEKFSKAAWFHCRQDPDAYISLTNVTIGEKKKDDEKEEEVFAGLRVPLPAAVEITDRLRSLGNS